MWRDLYDVLALRFAPGERWWPADSAFEVMVGAVLTQNTAWSRVTVALDHLRKASCLTPEAIAACPEDRLMALIRPAGSYTRKAKTLKRLVAWLEVNDGCAATLDDESLRQSLLSLSGIGPETADDLLLFVYDRPMFIFDAYARRLLVALGLPVSATYEGTRARHRESLAAAHLSVDEHKAFHALIVTAGQYARRAGWDALMGELAALGLKGVSNDVEGPADA